MSNLWQPGQPDNRGFAERNAGKLLLSAFLVSIPVRIVGGILGVHPGLLTFVSLLLFVSLIVASVSGYSERRKR